MQQSLLQHRLQTMTFLKILWLTEDKVYCTSSTKTTETYFKLNEHFLLSALGPRQQAETPYAYSLKSMMPSRLESNELKKPLVISSAMGGQTRLWNIW